MSSLFFSAITLLVCFAVAAAAPTKQAQQKLEPAVKAGLLQAAEDAQDKKRPAFDPNWFSGDSRRMAQMPPFIPSKKLDKMPGDPVCNPKCGYTCGHSECDQTCEPICLPPQCETLCAKSEDKCETRCNKPKCAVICPASAQECPNGDCPKCRTICAPPACTTSCSGSCHSVCTQPQCNWKCDRGKCPKPECKMSCTGFDKCHDHFPNTNLTKVPIMPGMDIKAEDSASMDPAVLTEPVVAPPAEGPKTLPQAHAESSLGFQNVPKAATTPSPLTKLKMKWQAQDLINQNERLLRR